MKVLAPANPHDAKGLLKSAIRDEDPVLFLENLMIYNERGEVPEGDYTVPIGVAAVPREGTDLTIVSHSYATVRALRVAKRLAEEGIEAEVVDLRSLRPLDVETIVTSVRKTHSCCASRGWPTYGVSAEIAGARAESVLCRAGCTGRAGGWGGGADAVRQAARDSGDRERREDLSGGARGAGREWDARAGCRRLLTCLKKS